MNDAPPPKIAVIGGGISGLSAAFYLQRFAEERSLDVQVSLLEASDHVGGVMKSSRRDGFLLEHGSDSFITSKPAVIEFIRDLGCEDQLIGTNPIERRAFIVRGGKLEPVPAGFYLLAPTSLRALWKNPLLSLAGKLRAGLDLLLPSQAKEDESLASFVTRRLGKEVFERIAQPMVGGIYTADPEKLSLAATFPAFLEMEREHGSVIRGMLARSAAAKHRPEGAGQASGPRYGLFATMREGLASLPRIASEALEPGTIELNKRVSSLRRIDEKWQVELAEGETRVFDAVILAMQAPRSARLLSESESQLAEALLEIEYASAAIVNLAFERDQLAHRLNGMGFVAPEAERRGILACTFSSVKFEGRAPEGKALFRVFMGGAMHPEIMELSDEEMIARARDELEKLIGASGEPLFATVDRWKNAMAQYYVGHKERISRIRALEHEIAGLALAGNGFEGVGIPDCIGGGKGAALRVLDSLALTS